MLAAPTWKQKVSEFPHRGSKARFTDCNSGSPLILFTGTSEAFLHAVATEHQLKRSNNSLFIFSGIYIVLNVLLIQSAGAVGLIAANSLNMIMRIVYSVIFIKRYFQEFIIFCVPPLLPSGWTALLLYGVITFLSEKLFLEQENFWPTIFIHFSIGLVCFCISAILIYRLEKPSSRKSSIFVAIRTEKIVKSKEGNKGNNLLYRTLKTARTHFFLFRCCI
ncbi:hypothetical protein GIB67_025611 [Kingdonia uniflora]|uniref:Protein RFT1 homolog n=1 Tax=Kingdonia uniflora TaxID=39325 RepID=A0A7J7N2C4_9MAGN|nr:hypothetical protein GIB67_025611 [Kingdonia uniflora]